MFTPPTVVIRTRSSVDDNDLPPPPTFRVVLPAVIVLVYVHVLVATSIKLIITCPEYALAATDEFVPKPDVNAVPLDVPATEITVEMYPVVSTAPSPSCTIKSDVPFVLKPLYIIVIRLAHDGIPVKSTLAVDAVTTVPDTMGANVPVVATSVCVFDPATAGAAKVMVPDVEPSSTTGDGVVMPVVPLITTVIISPRKEC